MENVTSAGAEPEPRDTANIIGNEEEQKQPRQEPINFR